MENLVFSGESVPIEVASQVMKKTPSYINSKNFTLWLCNEKTWSYKILLLH